MHRHDDDYNDLTLFDRLMFMVGIGVILAIIVVSMVGCQSGLLGPVDRPGPEIRERTVEITTAADTIDSHAAEIQTETEAGEQVAPGLPQWPTIWHLAQMIRDQADVIVAQSADIDDLSRQVDRLSDAQAAAMARIAELESELEQRRRAFLMWLWAASVIGVIVGVVLAVFVNRKAGAAIVVAALISATVAWLFMDYAWVAYVIGGGIGVGVLAWAAYDHFVLERRVVPQTMDTVEKMKRFTPDDERHRIYDETQDTDTQNRLLAYQVERKRK